MGYIIRLQECRKKEIVKKVAYINIRVPSFCGKAGRGFDVKSLQNVHNNNYCEKCVAVEDDIKILGIYPHC